MHEPAKRRPGRPTALTSETITREQMILGAADLFWRRGYAAVSISEIAAAIGVTKPTIYYHFPGKEALYTEVLRWTLLHIAEGIRAIARAPEPLRQRLHLLAAQGLQNAPADANLDAMMRDVTEHLSPAQQAEILAAHEAMVSAYEELMQDGIARGELKPGEPRLLAHCLRHLLEAFVGDRGDSFPDRFAAIDSAVALFLDGAAQAAESTQPIRDGPEYPASILSTDRLHQGVRTT